MNAGRSRMSPVRQSVNAAYDLLVVAAARTWKYQPATRNGSRSASSSRSS